MKITRYNNKDVKIPHKKCNTNDEFKDILKNTIIGVDKSNGIDIAVTGYLSMCNGIVNLLPIDKKERKNETRKK